MFKSAYLRLTTYYVAIIMAISLLFSFLLYNQTMREVETGLQNQTTKILRSSSFMGINPAPDALEELRQAQIDESRAHILLKLFYFNALILGLGAAVSYLLAKRTMQPLQEAMESQGRFTADASHELRTPLTAMKTEIEVALRDKNLTRAEATQLLGSNLEEIDRLTTLSEGLLTIARQDELPREPVALDKVVVDVCDRLKPLATKKKVNIDCKLSLAEVLANVHDLDKIIGILVDNAVKYSPSGTTVTVQTEPKGRSAQLTVQDHGYGIKASDLPHIFDRFYRADTSRTQEKIHGYGLGLSIARKIVDDLGGSISVDSSAGKGSTFIVRLPSL